MKRLRVKLNGKLLSKKTIVIILTAVVIGGTTAYVSIDKYNKNKELSEFIPREREYIASKGNITAGVKGAGSLKLDVVKHNFDESIVIGEVFVKEGQIVKAGDKLVSISESYLNEKLEELNKQLNEAKASLEQAKGNKRSTQLSNEKAWNDQIEASNNQYESQKRQLNEAISNLNSKINELNQKLNDIRNKIIEEEKNENSTLLDELKVKENSIVIEIESLDNELVTNKNNLSRLEEERKSELKSQENNKAITNEINSIGLKEIDNSIALAEEAVRMVENDISKINKLKESPILYSTVDGVVATVSSVDGNPTNVDGSIIDIGQSNKVTAEITVSQTDITSIEEGQEVKLEIGGYEGEEFKGKVNFVNLKPNTQGTSTTYSVTVGLEATDYKLLEGMTATAQFIIKEVKDVVTLSNKAIEVKDGKQIVKVRKADGSIEETNIQTGFSDGKVTEIISGVNDGDTVVVGG